LPGRFDIRHHKGKWFGLALLPLAQSLHRCHMQRIATEVVTTQPFDR
jgi:hypothetical protein